MRAGGWSWSRRPRRRRRLLGGVWSLPGVGSGRVFLGMTNGARATPAAGSSLYFLSQASAAGISQSSDLECFVLTNELQPTLPAALLFPFPSQRSC
jgi:hypothetical protein